MFRFIDYDPWVAQKFPKSSHALQKSRIGIESQSFCSLSASGSMKTYKTSVKTETVIPFRTSKPITQGSYSSKTSVGRSLSNDGPLQEPCYPSDQPSST